MNKKDLDKINLPNNLDDVIDEAINMAHEDKKKNKINKGYNKVFKTIAASVAIVITLGIGTTTLAQGISNIKIMFEEIHNSIKGNGSSLKYETEINKTVINNGIGITISEAIYDGQSLYITYKVESKDAFKYIKDNKFPNVVNNQILPLADIKLSFTDEKIIERNGRIEGKFIDDHTFIGVGQYDLIDLKKPIPNEFEFITTINALAIENMSSSDDEGQVFKGNWAFKIPVKVEKSLTKEIDINDVNERGLGINKIYNTPSEIKIITKHPKDMEIMSCMLYVFDENGKMILIESDKWYDDYSVATIIKDDRDFHKIRVEFWSEVVKGDEERANVDKDIIMYSKEINLDN